MNRSVGVPTAGARDAAAARGLRQVMGNGLALLGAYVIPRLFTAAAIVIAARALGAADFGAWGTAAAFAVILSVVSTLGMQPLLVREMARDPGRAPHWLRSAHVAKAVSGTAMLAALLFIGGALLHYPPTVLGAALLLGLGYAVGSFAENLSAWFQAVERMHVWTQASAVYGIVTGLLGSVLVTLTHSVVWFCAAPVAGQLAAVGWLALRLPRHARSGRLERVALASLLRELWPFAAAFVALAAFSKADVLLLERWRTAAEVGSYAAAYKFIDISQALGTVAAAAVYPRLSREVKGTAGSRLIELAILVAIPAAGFLYLARETIVLLLFGDAFGAAVAVVAPLAVAVPALGIAVVGGYILAAAGEMRRVAALYGLLLAVKLGLNAWLVPAYGAVGAGAAMLVSEILLASGMLALLAPRSAVIGRRVGLGALAGVTVWALAAVAPGDAVALRVAAFLAATVGAYAVAGAVPAADRAILLEALRGSGRTRSPR